MVLLQKLFSNPFPEPISLCVSSFTVGNSPPFPIYATYITQSFSRSGTLLCLYTSLHSVPTPIPKGQSWSTFLIPRVETHLTVFV